EAVPIALEKLDFVGNAESLIERSTFELSCCQMRRVAIAGILAMEPSLLVLDEPTGGLDAAGRQAGMARLSKVLDAGMRS
ncbi:ATP-binding cassette domain-containing protein, partial [Streptococcus suis]